LLTVLKNAQFYSLWLIFVLIVTLCSKVGAALVAHGHSVSVGLCQGYSAVLLPQLAAPNADLGAITPEQASWIGKFLSTY
jgi:hypothetical protein